MTKDSAPLAPLHWLLAAAIALLGAIILFDANAGINWAIWVALAISVTLLAQRPPNGETSRQTTLLALGAIVAAGADTRTTDTAVHVGIFWLTAVLLAVFLYSVTAAEGSEMRLFALITSPFYAAARVITSSLREIGAAFRAASDSPSKVIARRILLVAPVVLVLLFLLAGADPVIHSALNGIESWFPGITFDRAPFFVVLFLVVLGACSRMPQWNYGIPPNTLRIPGWPSAMDAVVLVGSTLATLVAFLLLQAVYLFVRLPNEIGNGVTYAEYARSGFGQLCVVVTIVAAVVILAERIRDAGETPHSATLRKMEIALVVAAGLILLSAQRRVGLYEDAYGYTVARVHATAYIVFMGVFLLLLANELRGGSITSALGRRSALAAVGVVLVLLYWNDQAWIMNRNIDRIRTSGKFDQRYAGSLSPDAFPTVAARRAELPAGAWDYISARAACHPFHGPFEWYEWNPVRSAAQSTKDALHIPDLSKCPTLPAKEAAQ